MRGGDGEARGGEVKVSWCGGEVRGGDGELRGGGGEVMGR